MDKSAATTEDETSRLSNVRHLNRGGNNNDKEADNNDGAQLDKDSPATTTTISSAILQLSFLWLHSTANNNKDDYGKKRQRQSSPCCKSSKFGYDDVDDGPDEDIEEADGGRGVPQWQQKQSNWLLATTLMMKMSSRGDWRKKYGSRSCRLPP